jgi:hypothetical protein
MARAVATSVAVSWRVVPAWPMGMQMTRPQYCRRAQRRGWYFSVFLASLPWQPRSQKKADLEEDEGAVLAVEEVEVPSGIG